MCRGAIMYITIGARLSFTISKIVFVNKKKLKTSYVNIMIATSIHLKSTKNKY